MLPVLQWLGDAYGFQLSYLSHSVSSYVCGWLKTFICCPCTDKPSPPRNLKVVETNKDYVVLSWSSPDSDGGSPLTGFLVERKDVTKTSFVSAGRCDAGTFQFRVTKLIEGNEYEFQVAVENEIGQSDWASLDKPVKAKLGFGEFLVF